MKALFSVCQISKLNPYLLILALFNYLESIAEVSLEDAAKFNANFFRQKIRDLLISEQIWGQKTQHGVNEIFKFYAKNSENKDNLFYLNCYTKAIHDCYFGVPAKMEMLEKMRCGWPVYNGIFDRLHQAVHPPKVPLKGFLPFYTIIKFSFSSNSWK